MEDEFKIKLEQSQIAGWRSKKEERATFFKRFDSDFGDVYDHLMSLEYDKIQAVCYLLSKLDKAIKICDFLDTLERDNNEDVDVIKIYILISHAEITSRSLGELGASIALVNNFFSPVESILKFKIRPSITSFVQKTASMNFADILYKIRCEYTHEGNYTGKIFKNKREGASTNIFSFKSNDETVMGECDVTYKEFLDIYMNALVENIKTFSNYEANTI